MPRFSAQVSRDPQGYAWVNAGGYGPEDGRALYAQSLFLLPVGLPELKQRWRETDEITLPNCYDPFVKEPALFRIFAGLDASPESILSFANQYGDITSLDVVVEEGGMTLDEWQWEIENMRDLVKEADGFISKRVPKRDLQKHAGDISAFIDHILSDVPVYLSTVMANGVIGLRTNAYKLFDVMKLQLVEAIVERKTYRTCEHCDKPFEVSPQINRSDRVYCSDNCRVKAYQRRRKQAIVMRAKGDTLREISKKLSSDVPTVKKWVGEAKKEE